MSHPGASKRQKELARQEKRRVKEEKREVTDFIARKFHLETPVAEETYRVVIQTLSEDGRVSQQALQELLDQVKKETGVKREIAIRDIVDYRMLREVAGATGG